MHNIDLLVAFLQYSTPSTQSGSMPMFGILVGVVAGFAADAGGRSGGRWGALAGAVVFAIAWAVNQPEGFELGGLGHVTQPLLMQVTMGAISGAVWCGLWGLLGGVFGRRIGDGHGPVRQPIDELDTQRSSDTVDSSHPGSRPATTP